MFGGFYQGKRVLITGVAGVKGSWLALAVLEAGGSVVGVDIRTPDADSNFAASALRQRIRFVQGDINDTGLMEALTQDVDAVFHLAAIALVGEARRRPIEAYRTNTLGTATVLEAIKRSASVTDAVMVTTDKVYRSKDGAAWVESDPLVATQPYPVSKACAEFIIGDYCRGSELGAGKRIGVARAGNVLIGGDFYSSRRTDGAGRLFVDCFEALMEGSSPTVFAPKFTRPYTYGLDVLAGYMTLMSNLGKAGVDREAFNFGPHEESEIPNATLATRICELWGGGATWKAGPFRDEPFERQSLSWAKARMRLGWEPAYTLDQALEDTTHWYRSWAARRGSLVEGGMAEVNLALMAKHRETARRIGIAWAD
jgi:CDP-glucose 4,6-dehydratase